MVYIMLADFLILWGAGIATSRQDVKISEEKSHQDIKKPLSPRPNKKKGFQNLTLAGLEIVVLDGVNHG